MRKRSKKHGNFAKFDLQESYRSSFAKIFGENCSCFAFFFFLHPSVPNEPYGIQWKKGSNFLKKIQKQQEVSIERKTFRGLIPHINLPDTEKKKKKALEKKWASNWTEKGG